MGDRLVLHQGAVDPCADLRAGAEACAKRMDTAETERDLEVAAKTATAARLLDALQDLSAAERRLDNERIVAELRSIKVNTLRDALAAARDAFVVLLDLVGDIGPAARTAASRARDDADHVLVAVDKRRVPSNSPVRLEPAGEVASGVPVTPGQRYEMTAYVSPAANPTDMDTCDRCGSFICSDGVCPRCGLDHVGEAHGTPVDDQPPAADERHLPDVGAEQGALDAGEVDRRTVGVGEVGVVRDVVDDKGHAATVAQAFERGE